MTNRRPSVPPPPKPIGPENEIFKIGNGFDTYWVFALGACFGVVVMAALFMALHQCQ